MGQFVEFIKIDNDVVRNLIKDFSSSADTSEALE